MIFINTRPTNRAKPLTESLQQQGIKVVELPLLALEKCELTQIDKQNLFSDNYQCILLVSETAVQYFFEFVQQNFYHFNHPKFLSQAFVVVGEKTATIFCQQFQQIFKQTPNIITPTQFHLSENNEGMLQLPVIKNLQKNDNLLICKGKDGRDLLKNTLQQQGVNVVTVDFYQRVFPPQTTNLFKNFYPHYKKDDKKPIVLISSLTAWQHWQDLLIQFGVLVNDFGYLVLQQRIANHLYHQHIEKVWVIDDLKPMTIYQKLSIRY